MYPIVIEYRRIVYFFERIKIHIKSHLVYGNLDIIFMYMNSPIKFFLTF